MYQKVMLIGNIGRDPELKYLPSGKAEGRGNGNRKQAGADVDKYRALYEQQQASSNTR